VGPVTAERLRERGIARLVDVRTADATRLRDAVGSMTDWLLKLATGNDDRPVEPNRPAKSSSSECTYAHDLTDLDRIREEIAEMARDNAVWLARKDLLVEFRSRTAILSAVVFTVLVLIISAVIAGYIFVVDNIFTATITRGILGSPEATPVP